MRDGRLKRLYENSLLKRTMKLNKINFPDWAYFTMVLIIVLGFLGYRIFRGN